VKINMAANSSSLQKIKCSVVSHILNDVKRNEIWILGIISFLYIHIWW